MAMVDGLLYQMTPASNLTHHVSRSHKKFVRKKYGSATKDKGDNFIIMLKTIIFH